MLTMRLFGCEITSTPLISLMMAHGNKHTHAQGCIAFLPAERQDIPFFIFFFPLSHVF